MSVLVGMGRKGNYRPTEPRTPEPEISVRYDAGVSHWVVAYEPLGAPSVRLADAPTSDEAMARAAVLAVDYPGVRVILHPGTGEWRRRGFWL